MFPFRRRAEDDDHALDQLFDLEEANELLMSEIVKLREEKRALMERNAALVDLLHPQARVARLVR